MKYDSGVQCYCGAHYDCVVCSVNAWCDVQYDCCEQGFSALCLSKKKLCLRLAVKDDIRVALPQTVPRINMLVINEQSHPSHRNILFYFCILYNNVNLIKLK